MAVTETSRLRNAAQALVDYCVNHGLQKAADRVWSYNAVIECAGALCPAPDVDWVLAEATPATDDAFDLDAALLDIAEAAVANGVADDTASGRDRVACRVMGLLMPKPSQVADEFARLATADGPMAATDWFYRLCCDAGYVRRSAIARNIEWSTPTQWGDLEITINLSKPEKDPREIAAAGATKDTGEKYPACQLCIENEGYPGRAASAAGGAHPARQNLRIIPIELGGERWGLQYSPYAYFNEHCIAMSCHHRPMHIDRAALTCLLDFVDTVPGYFIGSNADLPIVGGSILSHSHFQGGRYVFPMQKADIAVPMTDIRYPGVKAGILNWPVSAVRLVGRSSQQMQNVANNILSAWRSYTDESVGILAETDGTPHNTVTPILHYDETEGYILDLALRNNRTSEEYPDGIFHPHREYHNIKKENIGLIEVMGLAILPARLKDQGAQIAEILAGQRPNTSREAGDTLAVHADWIDELIAKYGTHMKPQDANKAVKAEIGTVFSHVLENAGVFKQDAAGQAAFVRFMQSVGFKKA